MKKQTYSWGRRTISALLIISLAVTSLSVSYKEVKAEEEVADIAIENEQEHRTSEPAGNEQQFVATDPDLVANEQEPVANEPAPVADEPAPVADEPESSWPILINNKSARISEEGFQMAQVIAYDELVTFSLETYAGTVEQSVFSYLKSDKVITEGMPWNNWVSDSPIVPGDYYLGYSFEQDGQAIYDLTGKYGVRIAKASLKAPENIQWKTGSTASWNPVTTTVQERELRGAPVAGYEVTLYKDGVLAETTTISDAATVSYDFTNLMVQHGHGAYTFQVSALVNGAGKGCYEASALSEPSGAVNVLQVTATGDTGIKSVAPEEPFLLIPGNASWNTKEISATLKNEKFAFDSWFCESPEITFTQGMAATLHVADTYAGASVIEVVAKTTDTEKPTITEYKVATLTDEETLGLTGKAKDMQTGIATYAFSTAMTAEQVEEWKLPEDTLPEAEVTLEHEIIAFGTYFLYVKDGFGNVTKSDTSIQATEVIYNNFYDNGSAQELTEYLLGTKTLTLRTPLRPGYLFEGWYNTAQFEGTPITSLDNTAHAVTSVNIYGKWSREEIVFAEEPKDIDITYDGKEHNLNAKVVNTAGTITYQWYKDGQPIQGAQDSTFKVKQVADAGNYYAEAIIVLDEVEIKKKSKEVTVAIEKKELTVKAANQEIRYAAAMPEYGIEYSGFAEDDTAENINLTEGEVTCIYQEGMNVGIYDITPSGFSAPNYDITHEKGTLNVKPIEVEEQDSMVTAQLAYGTMVYTGTEITPEVTVKRGELLLTVGTDYTVEYTDNKDVGTAKVRVTFKGNYKGTVVCEFTIIKSAFRPVVSLQGWTYGGTANTPQLDRNDSGGTVTYYYAKSQGTEFTTVQPAAAGVYDVYAVVAGTQNYEEITTDKITFTIAKRNIMLTAPDGEWAYDGSSHSNTTYAMTGSFANSDSFQSVTVAGQITNVGDVENVITYKLSSSTNPDNYIITCVNGKFTVTAVPLAVPVNNKWQSSTPGLATWVAVTRKELIVQYELKLYRTGGITGEAVLVDTVRTEHTEHSFIDVMKEDSEKIDAPAGYYFTVKAESFSGSNKINYLNSETSAKSDGIYTIQVTVEKENGVSEAFIGEKTKVILLQGENTAISAKTKTGYVFSDIAWSTKSKNLLSFSDASQAETVLRVSSQMKKPESVTIMAHAEDEKPLIERFEAEADATYNRVTFTLQAWDSTSITGWMISTEKNAPDVSDTGWNTESGASITVTESVNAAGSYYAYVKDTANNVVRSKSPLAIYEITFDKGETTEEGTMQRLLKVQNTTITLPENVFTKAGYGFRNWSGATGIYANGGTYAANKGDMLSAQWSDQQVNYNVEYYYMDITGKYAESPSNMSTFTGAHGASISVSDQAIQNSRTGMSVDTSDGKNTSITLNEGNLTLKVYYKLNSYTITYTYRIPGANEDTKEEQLFLYGTTVTDYTKPTVAGYEFVGWLYGEAGKKPDTMPNKNITATGSFSPVKATYLVNYYEENLPVEGQADKSYTRKQVLTEQRNASHAEAITFTTADTKQLEGFTIKGMTITYGEAGSNQPLDTDIGENKTGVASAIDSGKLQVNYYYTRNSYDLTLKVWKGNREIATNNLYSHKWSILYGAEITPAFYEQYDQTNWATPDQIEGYELAAYADWSTGQKPSKMPAGSVTVARDYIYRTTAHYTLDIYYESEVADTYEKAESLYYYSNEGKRITVGSGSSYTINYNNFKEYVEGFAYYDYNEGYEGNVTEGVVTATDKGQVPLKLKIYFKRKVAKTTIKYYYNEGGSDTASTLIGTLVKSGKWGDTYDCEPLAMFDGGGAPIGSYTSANATINGTSAESYHFRNNSYVVSYAGRHRMNGGGVWPGYKFTKASELVSPEKHSKVTFGNGVDDDADYINVYYTKIDPEDTYYLNVGYDPRKLNKATQSEKKFHQMTENIDGTDYKIRVANKADVFEATVSSGTETEADYPGAAPYSRVYEYGDLKTGYDMIEKDETTYYKKQEGTEQYLYLLDESNQFFKGNRTSYNFLGETNKAKVGMAVLDDYLAQYKIEHGDREDTENYDDAVVGAHYQNNGFSSIINDTKNNSNYTFTFDYAAIFKVTYNLGGSICKLHEFTDNQEVTPGCEHSIFEEREGYSIAWYMDSLFRIKATPFQIKDDMMFFGRYEKNTLDVHEYIYYELADAITIDEEETSYITAENLEAVKALLKDTLSSETTEGEEITFVDGAGTTSYPKVQVTTYTYQGKVVMIDRQYPCLTFQQVSMNERYEDYIKSGYHYDNTNGSNRLYGYCQTEAVPLSVYYARDTFEVTVIPNNTKVSNSETTEYRFGQTVSIKKPDKNGYEFAGWKWEEYVADNEDGTEQWKAWENAPLLNSEQGVTFIMPSLKLRAEAIWTAGEFKQTITHYFQDETQTYKTELLKTLKDTAFADTAINVLFNEEELLDGKAYYNELELLGVSGELADGRTVWFSKAAIKNKQATADVSDLIAIEQPVDIKSEQRTAVKAYVNTDFTMFSYSFTIYQEDVTVQTLNQEDGFTNTYGMQVDYYYTREANVTVRTIAKALDGGASGTPIGGTINSFYGQNIELKLNLAVGYEFAGWYKAQDVLEGYTPEGEMETLTLKSDTMTKTPISTAEDLSLRVTEKMDCVAVTKAKTVTTPSVTVGGVNEYTYGYASTTENALKTEVNLAGGDAEFTYVSGYQWYEGETAIAGATSSTYLFPTGKDAGTYTYKCIVTVGRKDNGRTATVETTSYGVAVKPAEMRVEATGYTGVYDGKSHGITVRVRTPADAAAYEIYYSKKALTEENYKTEGNTNPLVYKDVEVDGEDKAIPHTVYYYVENPQGNYQGATGSATVKINPITLTAKAGKEYTKGYDKTEAIEGSVTDAGTGKYALAHDGHYTVNGLLPEDQGAQYLLDFDASFNSMHVKEASYITLSNMVVVDNAAERNYNYAFTTGSELIISGYITPYILNVNWLDAEAIIYDGEKHAPTIQLAGGQTTPDPIEIAVLGEQRNVGTYTAYASVKDSTAYQPGDYAFTLGTREFKIVTRPITITPVKTELTYNGDTQKITEYAVEGLVAEQTYTAGTNIGGKDAGTYDVTAINMVIQSDGKTITDNYAITYGSADLKIKPKSVTVSNVTAEDKVYDNTTVATLNLAAIEFDGLLPEETLELEATKISGTFDTAAAGEDKKVTLAVEEGVLIGNGSNNYALNWGQSQQETRASITKETITITVNNSTIVYGEEAPFTVTYTGFKGSDTQETVITGTPSYTVKKSDAENDKPYEKTDAVGTYDIIIGTENLQAANYEFVIKPSKPTLHVEQRPIQVGPAVTGRALSKVYDGTTQGKQLVTTVDYAFRNIAEDVASGPVNGDMLQLHDDAVTGYTAEYNSKDVKDAHTITVANLTLNNANYTLANTEFIIPGRTITAKNLEVMADNKAITYGENAPIYTASYGAGGFVQEEDETVLGGTLALACEYDINDSGNRQVRADGYTITASGYVSDTDSNYNISYKTGKLTVGKAEICITADDKTITYKMDTLPSAYTGQFTGFKYGETDTVIQNAEVTYSCTADANTVAGTYPINVTLKTDIAADNYSFKAVPGTLTIGRKEITISGIEIAAKEYDGTTALKSEQLIGTVVYDGIDLLDENDRGFVFETGSYVTKDVGNDIEVTFTVKLNEYLSQRYLLNDASQTKATGHITKKELTIKADSKTIKYGAAVPVYTATYTGFLSGEEEHKGDLTGTLAFDCNYVQGSGVASYEITPKDNTSNNYNIIFEKNNLTVEKTALAKPVATWSATQPGTVTWSAIPQIGNVTVANYVVTLYKDKEADPVDTKTVSGSLTSSDLLATIRSKGAGKYTVKVKAVASTDATTNQGNKNVADSAEGISPAIYAAEVSAVFAADAITAAGKQTITVNTAAAYTVVAGEKEIPIVATFQNATGYTVKEWSGDTTALTMTDGSQTGNTYTAKVACNKQLTDSKPLKLTLSLAATPATVEGTVTANPAEAPYGYTAANAPQLTVAVTPESDDTISGAGYTYTYQWKILERMGGLWKNIDGATGTTLSLPSNYSAYNNYRVTCDVVAIRGDNGQSKSFTPTAVKIVIKPAEFASDVQLDGWQYGATRETPSVTYNPENTKETYSYNTSAVATTEWTETMPTDAGTYYVKAVIEKSLNFQELTTLPKEFTITPATLATPIGLEMKPSTTAPYGKATWQAVEGPKENAGGAGMESSINVSYQVRLYRAENTSSAWEVIKTYDPTTSCEVDMTREITNTGVYRFTVTAIAASTNGKANCNNSQESATSVELDVSGMISAPEGIYGKIYDGTSIPLRVMYTADGEKRYQWYCNDKKIEGATQDTYDVTYVEQNGVYSCNITLGGETYSSTHQAVTITPRPITIVSPSEQKTYDGTPLENKQWSYQDGSVQVVSGETITCVLDGTITNKGTQSNTISSVTIKAGEGVAGKILYEDGGADNNYAVTRQEGTLEIQAVDLTSEDIKATTPEARTYNGTKQEQSITVTDIRIGDTGYTLKKDTDYTVSYENNIHAGTAKVILQGKDNYKGVLSQTFTITPRAITLRSADLTKAYDKTALKAEGVGNLNVVIGTGTLAAGDALASVVFTGSQTNAGESPNMYTDAVIKNENGTGDVVTSNYLVTPEYGTLTVTKIQDTIEIKRDQTKTYDGAAVINPTDEEVEKEGTGAVTFTYYTETEGVYTALTENPKAAGFYYVKANELEDTNYLPSQSDYKKFEIKTRKVTLTADAKSSIYGEDLKELTYTAKMTEPDTGEEAIVEGDNLNIVLSSAVTASSKVDSYDITITASNGNYEITTIKGVYTIESNKISATVVGYESVYDGQEHSITVTPNQTDADVYYGAQLLTADNYWTAGSTFNPSYTDAGEYSVYYYIHKDNYTPLSGMTTVKISKAEQVITAANVTKTYDGNSHSIMATSNGDGVISYTNNTKSEAGEYTVTIEATGTKNYNQASITAILKINQKRITNGTSEAQGIEITAPIDTTYNGAAQTQTMAVVDTNRGTTGQTLIKDTDYSVSYEDNIFAGTAKVTIEGIGNYAGTFIQTFKINKCAITLRSESWSKTYDKQPLTAKGISDLHISVELGQGHLAAGDVLTGATFTGSQTNAGTSNSTYTKVIIKNQLGLGAVVTDNYLVTAKYGTLTVTQSSDTIIINRNQTKTYDGTAVSNLTDSDITRNGTGTVTYTYYTEKDGAYTALAENPKAAGTYYVKAQAAQDTNYLPAESGYKQFKINARKITLTADDKSSIYGETLEALTYSARMTAVGSSELAIVAGDNLNIALNSTVTASSLVGNYDITITASNPNYDITANQGTYRVKVNAVSAIVAGYKDSYDGNLHSITVTPQPIDATVYYGTEALTKDNYTTKGSTTNPSYKETGNYSVYYYIHKDNYTPLSGMESVEISKATQVISGADIEVLYDGIDHSIMATTNGDGTISYTNNGKINAGEYTVVIEASETKNYEKASKEVVLRIKKRPITIQAASASKVYDGTSLINPNYIIQEGTLADGDSIDSVQVSGSQTEVGSSMNSVSNASIKAGAAGEERTENYQITYIVGVLKVERNLQNPAPQNPTPQNPEQGNVTSLGRAANPTPNIITDGIGAQTPNLEAQAGAENPKPAVNKDAGNPEGVMLEDKKVSKTEITPYGSGNIKVVIESSENEIKHVNAALTSLQQVIDATLSKEEKLAVVDGNSMEIRLTIQVLKEEVPKEDADLIRGQIQKLEKEIEGLTLGQYMDIALDKRYNQGEWQRIEEAKEDIGIEIGIAEHLQFKNASYFVSRAHGGNTMLLHDVDTVPEKTTISSRYFSTYALLYTVEAAKVCIWHIIMFITLAIYLLTVLAWKEERRKRYRVLLAGTVVIFIIAAIVGTCRMDLPIAIGSTAVVYIAVPIKKRLSSSEE